MILVLGAPPNFCSNSCNPHGVLAVLAEIFWDPDPEHTLVEEDQEWVSLCPPPQSWVAVQVLHVDKLP